MAVSKSRSIRVSTRRTGERVIVRVVVYDDVESLRAACRRYSPNKDDDFWATTVGACQTFFATAEPDPESEVVYRAPVVVRLARGHLGTRVVTHEMNHAAAEVYARSIDLLSPAGEHFHVANETLAHIASDLTGSLVDRLYALGYYDR